MRKRLISTLLFSFLWAVSRANETTTTASASSSPPNNGTNEGENRKSVSRRADFFDLVASGILFIDKSSMIKEYLDHPHRVLLIRRPRKWGKSINLDMMRRFLEVELDIDGNPVPDDKLVNRKLFAGGRLNVSEEGTDKWRMKTLKPLRIARSGLTMSKQGTFPVIYLNLREVSGFMDIYNEIEYHVRNKVEDLYMQHHYLKRLLAPDNKLLTGQERDKLYVYLEKDYGVAELKESVRFLSQMLYKYYQKKVHVLIDAFDEPITRLYLNITEKYRKKINDSSRYAEIYRLADQSKDFRLTVELLSGIFDRCLDPNNEAIAKALITGILRLNGTGDIFANRTDVVRDYTVLDEDFSKYYGFTQYDVDDMVYDLNLVARRSEFREWYGGYGLQREAYNTWSIVQCLDYGARMCYYWLNECHSGIVDYALGLGNKTVELTEKFRQLVHESAVESSVSKTVNFSRVAHDDRQLYGLLLFTGYLAADRVKPNPDGTYSCHLSIPNAEIRNMYTEKIKKR